MAQDTVAIIGGNWKQCCKRFLAVLCLYEYIYTVVIVCPGWDTCGLVLPSSPLLLSQKYTNEATLGLFPVIPFESTCQRMPWSSLTTIFLHLWQMRQSWYPRRGVDFHYIVQKVCLQRDQLFCWKAQGGVSSRSKVPRSLFLIMASAVSPLLVTYLKFSSLCSEKFYHI